MRRSDYRYLNDLAARYGQTPMRWDSPGTVTASVTLNLYAVDQTPKLWSRGGDA